MVDFSTDGDPARDLAGPLQPLLEVAGVTDIVVNRPDQVWMDRGLGLEHADIQFAHEGEVRELAVKLASLGGQRLDDAAPVVDARLPDGTRMHAVLPPIAQGCTALSLRTVRTTALAMEDLVAGGMLSPALVNVMRGLVASRASVLVSGATGSGKTTLLASLLSLVDPAERIVVIEEAGEVMPNHPHVVRLVERRANVDGAGALGLATLVREALRMRPDRVVLGECRGAEVREVLAAFNTGHRGGFATIHANSARDVPARLESLGALAGMGARTVALYAAAGFDAVIHVERGQYGRRVCEVGLMVAESGRDAGEMTLRVTPALTMDESGHAVHGEAWGDLWRLAGLGKDADSPTSATATRHAPPAVTTANARAA